MSGRVSGFWLQQGDMDDDDQGDLPFGREFAQNKVRLNRRARGEGSIAVAEGHYKRQPRKALRSLKRVTHGAAVLGEGVLRSKSQHSLVLVDLPAPAVRDTSGRLVPFFIIAGLVYILAKTRRLAEQHEIAAPGLPVVINLSFGVLAGPKDGSSPIEQVFDALSVENLGLPGVGPVHIVVPMGNGRLEQCIAKLEEGKPRDLGQIGDLALLPGLDQLVGVIGCVVDIAQAHQREGAAFQQLGAQGVIQHGLTVILCRGAVIAQHARLPRRQIRTGQPARVSGPGKANRQSEGEVPPGRFHGTLRSALVPNLVAVPDRHNTDGGALHIRVKL